MADDQVIPTDAANPLAANPVAANPLAAAPATHGIMGDFVFGGIESDDTRMLAVERARWSGLRHEYALQPRDPRPGEPVTLTVTAGPDTPVNHVVAYVTSDNREPLGHRGVASVGTAFAFTRSGVRWESVIWSFVDEWQVTLPALPADTVVRYVIQGWLGEAEDAPSYWSREIAIDGSLDPITHYAYVVDEEEVPAWARQAVVYQVFVDRFRDHRRPLEAHTEMEPEALRDFWGGTLRGLIESLDWLQALGVDVLWPTPFFATPTYHGYDTTDYYQVDPRFGTNDDLRELVQQAHARGMRVILDLVVNHTSLDFAPFVAALANPKAPERDWFSWGPQYTHGYRTFFNVRSMPQLNLDHPAAREAMCDVARYWLREYDVDGYRLDYAAGPSHAFWSYFRRACRAAKSDCWLFGEVTRAGDILRAYSGRLDGCLDFGFAREVRRLANNPDVTLGHFAAWYTGSRNFFGSGFNLPSFLDNHDMNRFLWAVQGDRRKLRFGIALLLALGDSPILYYGTEVAQGQPRAKGPWREESRHPMPWNPAHQDAEVLAHTRAWIATRRAHPVLAQGSNRTLLLDEARRTWLLERSGSGERLLVAVNAGEVSQRVALPDDAPGVAWRDEQGTLHRGTLGLPAWSVALLTQPAPVG
ncbi:MAG: alpha-amylase family glycosyl hydrolase [Caldilineaceae bacterium]